MRIFINDKPADITLDTEKTLGDVLQGIDLWVSQTGNRIQGISLDGEILENDKLAGNLSMDIQRINKLEVAVRSWRELAAEALETLLGTCEHFINAQFDERNQIKQDWEKSAASRFLATDIKDIFDLAGFVLSGEGISASDLATLIEERKRELTDPAAETAAIETLVKGVAVRMEELPLDIQTGKDQRAAETVQLFARTGEKLFRIFFLLKPEWGSLDTFTIEDLPARNFIDDFNAALRELSAAYENRDTVLAGDIAEYELAPRLLQFYTALRNITELDNSVIPKP